MIRFFSKTVFVVFLLLTLFSNIAKASEKEVNLYFFWSSGCPHCATEKLFLNRLEQKYKNLNIKSYEVSQSAENAKILLKTGQVLSANVSGVPFTVIGNKYFTGYLSDDTTGQEIEKSIVSSIKGKNPEFLEGKIPEVSQQKTPIITKIKEMFSPPKVKKSTLPKHLTFPLIGKVSLNAVSLPVITILIALLDGFNPCAMWVLIFLISLLLGMKNKKRRWALGIVFIVASVFVYFLFMTAWLNLFLFLGFVVWIRYILGLLSLSVAFYHFKDLIFNQDSGCKVTKPQERRQLLEKIKNVAQSKKVVFAILGIIILAFAVNIVEAVCSAGLPAIYTQILALNNLPVWQYYAYIGLYLIVFMIDDIIIFTIAMTTLQITGIESKYTRYSHLFGAIILFILGILLIFKPELLMFA
jgi:thiol-disulfide isomerase/thioredoxin